MIIDINSFDNKYDFSKLEKNCKLIFKKGEYHFYKEDSKLVRIHFSNTDTIKYPEKSVYFYLKDISDIEFDGNGSKFIFHGDLASAVLENCERIKFKNIKMDYHVPTCVELLVQEVDFWANTIKYFVPKTWDFEVVGNKVLWFSEKDKYGKYYWVGENHFDSYAITIVDIENKFSKRENPENGPFSNAKKIERLDNQIIVEYHELPKLIRENTLVVLNASRKRDNTGFAVIESSDISFENVEFNYFHGFSLLLQMSENISFKDCKFIGNERHKISSFADSIHASGIKGEIKIENCIFDLSLDDPINIHGTYTRVEEIQGNKAVLRYVHHQQAGFKQYFVGDLVQFFDRNSLNPREEKLYKVKSVKHPGEYSTDLQYMEVEFEQELPDYLQEKLEDGGRFVCENVTYTPDVYIRNCKFYRSPVRGILCTTRGKVVIENNYFENNLMASIFLSNDANDWYESGRLENVDIRKNTFYYSKELQNRQKVVSILIKPIILDEDKSIKVNKNILVRDNVFYQNEDEAFRVYNAENFVQQNNSFI